MYRRFNNKFSKFQMVLQQQLTSNKLLFYIDLEMYFNQGSLIINKFKYVIDNYTA